jgi:hypothetical protein
LQRGQAFGLAIEAHFPLPGLPSLAAHGGRDSKSLVRLVLASEVEITAAWPADATVLSHRSRPDGRVVQRIEMDADAGYLMDWSGGGRYLIAADGSLVRCVPPRLPNQSWQRFLVGQVLPFAAVLSGFEVFHASAVTDGHRTIAFTGPSGAGKSSIATALRLRGWDLVADDVVAAGLSADGDVLAYPAFGTADMGWDALSGLGADDLHSLGDAVDHDEKGVRLLAPVVPKARPLTSFYLLERTDQERRTVIEPVRAVRPTRLLSATYNLLICTPARLIRQLELCSRLADTLDVYRLAITPDLDALATARLVEDCALTPRHLAAAG